MVAGPGKCSAQASLDLLRGIPGVRSGALTPGVSRTARNPLEEPSRMEKPTVCMRKPGSGDPGVLLIR